MKMDTWLNANTVHNFVSLLASGGGPTYSLNVSVKLLAFVIQHRACVTERSLALDPVAQVPVNLNRSQQSAVGCADVTVGFLYVF
jgi:hypothetical protein